MAIVYLAKVTDSEKKGRQAGDPLECECPVCARIKGVIEDARQTEDIGNGISLGIAKDSRRGPKDGTGLRRPNLEKTIDLPAGELIPNLWQRAADGQKEDVPDTESGRLYIKLVFAWSGDGREL